ncbi:MAG: threonine/serine dehydratase [Piscinibacter sp.]|uniref:threonine/serine dehydratase n=1 Tax=Piscinibacter sp. TaxID=1903157 RepID=UPI001B6774EC|nr:threonine/serine dehydratase [Piscinibacter sp.]MBP5989509.1 threonine/serine dehydratase [Piscinibacter sp.]MBP6027230.1 threonine/serine dehydratase [Piscinibacter sp.]
MISRDDIEAAAQRIAPHVRRTPLWVLRSDELGLPGPGFEVWLKLEQLQRSGSFKARGMFNRLLANPIPAAGVIAASGGNAGIATATAAQALGVPAEIFVPAVISPAKRDRLEQLGARVVVTGAVYAEAFAACQQRQRESGALMTHAYDQAEVLAGAGTLAREIESQAGVPDALLVSVGGGGLAGGIAAWFAGRTRMVALEPERAPTLHAALAAGGPVDVEVSGIAADALGARRIGALAWEVAQRHPMSSLVLRDEDIVDAQRWLWQSLKLAVEPAAALPLAALRSGAWQAQAGQRICLVLCGANVDPASLI